MPLAPQRVHHVVIHSEQPYRDLAVPRSDIRRLARYLTNTAIGLVLGDMLMWAYYEPWKSWEFLQIT